MFRHPPHPTHRDRNPGCAARAEPVARAGALEAEGGHLGLGGADAEAGGALDHGVDVLQRREEVVVVRRPRGHPLLPHRPMRGGDIRTFLDDRRGGSGSSFSSCWMDPLGWGTSPLPIAFSGAHQRRGEGRGPAPCQRRGWNTHTSRGEHQERLKCANAHAHVPGRRHKESA